MILKRNNYIRYIATEAGMALAGLGSALGTTAINGGLTSLARSENFDYNEQAANNANRRAIDLYRQFESPEAMVRQYKQAGLSVGLLSGNGAGGNVGYGAQGQGSAGMNAPQMQSPDLVGMMNQTKLAEAQADLMKSQADKNRNDMNIDNMKLPLEIKSMELQNAGQETQNQILKYNEIVEKVNADASEENMRLYQETAKQTLKTLENDNAVNGDPKVIEAKRKEIIANSVAAEYSAKIQKVISEHQEDLTKAQIGSLNRANKNMWSILDSGGNLSEAVNSALTAVAEMFGFKKDENEHWKYNPKGNEIQMENSLFSAWGKILNDPNADKIIKLINEGKTKEAAKLFFGE